MGVMSDPGGTDNGDIHLSDDDGFTGLIAASDWLTVGAPVAVARPVHGNGPWDGKVLAFHRSMRSVAEWHLASGEQRQAAFYSDPSDGYVTGKKFPVTMGRNTWAATVTSHEPMIRVTASYTIQTGARRRRDLFCAGELTVYARPEGDDRVAIVLATDPRPKGDM